MARLAGVTQPFGKCLFYQWLKTGGLARGRCEHRVAVGRGRFLLATLLPSSINLLNCFPECVGHSNEPVSPQ